MTSVASRPQVNDAAISHASAAASATSNASNETAPLASAQTPLAVVARSHQQPRTTAVQRTQAKTWDRRSRPMTGSFPDSFICVCLLLYAVINVRSNGANRPVEYRESGREVSPLRRDCATLKTMRWERLFADLAAGLDSSELADLEAEVADRTRRELARLRFVDRLRPSIGTQVSVTCMGD